jgi:hypothetical protein
MVNLVVCRDPHGARCLIRLSAKELPESYGDTSQVFGAGIEHQSCQRPGVNTTGQKYTDGNVRNKMCSD